MTVEQVARSLGLNVRSGASKLDRKVSGAYVSDLLSDVMGNAKEGDIWITLQVHQNVVAVATLLNLSAVIISRGAEPDEATIAKAEQEGVPFLTSPEPTFEVAGRLYQLIQNADTYSEFRGLNTVFPNSTDSPVGSRNVKDDQVPVSYCTQTGLHKSDDARKSGARCRLNQSSYA